MVEGSLGDACVCVCVWKRLIFGQLLTVGRQQVTRESTREWIVQVYSRGWKAEAKV
jgi:hypothetical protein